MQYISATFCRVFDVVRQDPPFFSRGRNVKTTFGFEDEAGEKHYIVSVSGLPKVESGMKVIALLETEDDWNSLVGWRDVETGEIAGINIDAQRAGMVIALMGALSLTAAISNSEWLMSAFLMAVVVFGSYVWLRQARLNRMLQALTKDSIVPTQKAAQAGELTS